MKYVDNGPKPVKKIELNEKNVKLRFILFILSFLVVVACAILIFVNLFKKESGFTTIESYPTINMQNDFVFSYDVGNTDLSITEEINNLSNKYTSLLEFSYIQFDIYSDHDQKNINYINNHINQDIQISELLYDSIEDVVNENEKLLYLAPIYAYYNDMFSTELDLNMLDPYQNINVQNYFKDILDYINSNSIKINLLSNNTINLYVSEDYINYLNENDVFYYIDFGFLKNSFIIDYIAENLLLAGYNKGNIKSYDGYFVNLDSSLDYNFVIDVLDNVNNFGSRVCNFTVKGKTSVVQFRNFMYYQNDIYRYVKMPDNSYRHIYIDYNDGLSKSSTNSLTSYSTELSCSEIALKTYRGFISDNFSLATTDQIKQVWIVNTYIYYNDQSISLQNLYDINNVKYEGVMVND